MSDYPTLEGLKAAVEAQGRAEADILRMAKALFVPGARVATGGPSAGAWSVTRLFTDPRIVVEATRFGQPMRISLRQIVAVAPQKLSASALSPVLAGAAGANPTTGDPLPPAVADTGERPLTATSPPAGSSGPAGSRLPEEGPRPWGDLSVEERAEVRKRARRDQEDAK